FALDISRQSASDPPKRATGGRWDSARQSGKRSSNTLLWGIEISLANSKSSKRYDARATRPKEPNGGSPSSSAFCSPTKGISRGFKIQNDPPPHLAKPGEAGEFSTAPMTSGRLPAHISGC